MKNIIMKIMVIKYHLIRVAIVLFETIKLKFDVITINKRVEEYIILVKERLECKELNYNPIF